MIKLIGLVLIAISVTAAGEKYAVIMKNRSLSLKALSDMIIKLGEEILAFKIPASDFFANYSDPQLDKTGMTELLKKMSLSDALNQCKETLNIDGKGFDIVCGFAENFGTESSEKEANKCEYYGRCLKELYEKEESELVPKTKLLRLSGVLCAVLGAIVFI